MKKNIKNPINRFNAIRQAVVKMPFFRIENLLVVEKNQDYLKIALSRMKKRMEIVQIKRGMYVSSKYLNYIRIRGDIYSYYEFIGAAMYEPSYLSAEYILAEHGVLTESVTGFTSISIRKTYKFINDFGIFTYHHIKNELFIGFKTIRKNNYLIYKASLAKAMFDFIYLRKNILINRKTVEELRLNLDSFRKKDIGELRGYVKLERSRRMSDILGWLIGTPKHKNTKIN